MKKALYFALMLCYSAMSATETKPSAGCDTLLTTDGKIYICNILKQNGREILFSLCDEPTETVYSIPKQRILTVKKFRPVKNRILEITSEPQQSKRNNSTAQPSKSPVKKRIRTPETEAKSALTLGILAFAMSASLFLSPVGFFIGLAALHKGNKVLKMLKGRPNARKLRRKARWAMLLGALGVIIFLCLFFWIFHLLSTWQGIGPFNIGFGWCATC